MRIRRTSTPPKAAPSATDNDVAVHTGHLLISLCQTCCYTWKGATVLCIDQDLCEAHKRKTAEYLRLYLYRYIEVLIRSVLRGPIRLSHSLPVLLRTLQMGQHLAWILAGCTSFVKEDTNTMPTGTSSTPASHQSSSSSNYTISEVPVVHTRTLYQWCPIRLPQRECWFGEPC